MREHRNTPLQPLSAVLPDAVKFVWEAKRRAEESRLLAESEHQPTPEPLVPNAEVKASVLALMAKFGGKRDADVDANAIVSAPVVQASAPARPRRSALAREANPNCEMHSGAFERQDDGKLADAMWLNFEFGRVPNFHKSGLRTAAAGREKFTRGIWRAALAGVLRNHPQSVTSPVGTLVVAARKAQETGLDPRMDATYCAARGWGVEAYTMCGVSGMIHQREGCRCE